MVRSIFFFRHVSTPHVRGAFGARGPSIERPRCSSFRAMAEASAVISYQPTQDAFRSFGPDRTGRCPLPSCEAPPAEDWRGPWVRGVRGADFRCRRSSTFYLLPLAPLPDTFVTVRDPRGLAALDIVRTGPGSRDPKAIPARCLPPSTRARPEPSSRHAPRTVPKYLFYPVDRGPMTGLPPHPLGSTPRGGRTPRRASQHLDGFCDRRLANSCSLAHRPDKFPRPAG
jgi:hypothetical protein